MTRCTVRPAGVSRRDSAPRSTAIPGGRHGLLAKPRASRSSPKSAGREDGPTHHCIGSRRRPKYSNVSSIREAASSSVNCEWMTPFSDPSGTPVANHKRSGSSCITAPGSRPKHSPELRHVGLYRRDQLRRRNLLQRHHQKLALLGSDGSGTILPKIAADAGLRCLSRFHSFRNVLSRFSLCDAQLESVLEVLPQLWRRAEVTG